MTIPQKGRRDRPSIALVGSALTRLGKRLASPVVWILGTATVVLALTVAGGNDGPLPNNSTAAEPGGESVFVHRATSQNTSANSTYLDHPLTNGNPDAVLSVTQNWNPGGGAGTYNAHPFGVWYDGSAEKWAIANEDRAAMPGGAAFNVVVSAAEAPVPEPPAASTQQYPDMPTGTQQYPDR